MSLQSSSADCPLPSSSSPIVHNPALPPHDILKMKDLPASTARHIRTQLYPKRRPSPHRDGITKSRARDSPYTHSTRRTPAAIKAELRQRERAAQLRAYHRNGIFVEEEYREEICYYMHEMERYTMSSASAMDQQPEIRWHMRPCLVDFLVEIHFTFRLRPETLYLTLNVVDRYVSRRIVYTKHYQLVGCAALWIAAKFEDAKERVPTVQELVHICRNTYDESAFLQMEGHILTTIQWTLGHPTAEAWLRFFCCGHYEESTKVQHVARFLMEITLFYREYINYAPSDIALACLILARFTCQQPRQIYDESEACIEVINLLDERLAKNVNDLSETLVKKYSYEFYSKASTHVLQWYLKGKRFVRYALPCLAPATPVSSRSPLSSLSTPMSAMTVSTDSSSDDMPVTPTSPGYSTDPFSSVPSSVVTESDKENVPTAYESVSKSTIPSSDDFSDYHTSSYGRHALHELNGLAPSPIRHIVS